MIPLFNDACLYPMKAHNSLSCSMYYSQSTVFSFTPWNTHTKTAAPNTTYYVPEAASWLTLGIPHRRQAFSSVQPAKLMSYWFYLRAYAAHSIVVCSWEHVLASVPLHWASPLIAQVYIVCDRWRCDRWLALSPEWLWQHGEQAACSPISLSLSYWLREICMVFYESFILSVFSWFIREGNETKSYRVLISNTWRWNFRWKMAKLIVMLPINPAI